MTTSFRTRLGNWATEEHHLGLLNQYKHHSQLLKKENFSFIHFGRNAFYNEPGTTQLTPEADLVANSFFVAIEVVAFLLFGFFFAPCWSAT